MISLKRKEIKIITGSSKIFKKNSSPFNSECLDFLSMLSKAILNKKNLFKYTDLISFAFWCRSSNIKKKRQYLINQDHYIRKGIGTLLHVPPSNTPIAAAYSFAFGLLSGNSNIIRVSNPNLENIKIFLIIINKLFKNKKFKKIKKNNVFISYDKASSVSENLSNLIDGRIIWGNEKTIKNFKRMNTKNLCQDVFFDDKYSVSIIDLKKYSLLTEIKKDKLIKNFYNDTFIMDQNACSSPHLVFWINTGSKINDFWKRLDKFVGKKYEITNDLQNIKYDRLNKILFNSDMLVESHDLEKISIYKIKKLNSDIVNLRGYAGIFFESKIKNIDNLKKIINEKFQTITYFGIDRNKLENFVKNKELLGLCRVVPVGQAIDMDLVWDGKNLINELTRIIEVK